MDNNNITPQPPAPAAQDAPDGVWISREEYTRLREQAFSSPAVGQSTLQPDAFLSLNDEKPSPMNMTQIIIGGLLAIGLLLALTTEAFSLLSFPLLFLFIVFAVVSLSGFFKANSGKALTAKGNSSLIKTLIIIAIILLALPILGPALMIVLFIIVIGLSGGSAGS